MATNKQIKAIRFIAKKWGSGYVRMNNNKSHREAVIYRGMFSSCEFPYNLMLKEIQEWLDENNVSYRFTPEYHNGMFQQLTIIIE